MEGRSITAEVLWIGRGYEGDGRPKDKLRLSRLVDRLLGRSHRYALPRWSVGVVFIMVSCQYPDENDPNEPYTSRLGPLPLKRQDAKGPCSKVL